MHPNSCLRLLAAVTLLVVLLSVISSVECRGKSVHPRARPRPRLHQQQQQQQQQQPRQPLFSSLQRRKPPLKRNSVHHAPNPFLRGNKNNARPPRFRPSREVPPSKTPPPLPVILTPEPQPSPSSPELLYQINDASPAQYQINDESAAQAAVDLQPAQEAQVEEDNSQVQEENAFSSHVSRPSYQFKSEDFGSTPFEFVPVQSAYHKQNDVRSVDPSESSALFYPESPSAIASAAAPAPAAAPGAQVPASDATATATAPSTSSDDPLAAAAALAASPPSAPVAPVYQVDAASSQPPLDVQPISQADTNEVVENIEEPAPAPEAAQPDPYRWKPLQAIENSQGTGYSAPPEAAAPQTPQPPQPPQQPPQPPQPQPESNSVPEDNGPPEQDVPIAAYSFNDFYSPPSPPAPSSPPPPPPPPESSPVPAVPAVPAAPETTEAQGSGQYRQEPTAGPVYYKPVESTPAPPSPAPASSEAPQPPPPAPASYEAPQPPPASSEPPQPPVPAEPAYGAPSEEPAPVEEAQPSAPETEVPSPDYSVSSAPPQPSYEAPIDIADNSTYPSGDKGFGFANGIFKIPDAFRTFLNSPPSWINKSAWK